MRESVSRMLCMKGPRTDCILPLFDERGRLETTARTSLWKSNIFHQYTRRCGSSLLSQNAKDNHHSHRYTCKRQYEFISLLGSRSPSGSNYPQKFNFTIAPSVIEVGPGLMTYKIRSASGGIMPGKPLDKHDGQPSRSSPQTAFIPGPVTQRTGPQISF